MTMELHPSIAKSVRTSRSSFSSSNGNEDTPVHSAAAYLNGDEYDSDSSNVAPPTKKGGKDSGSLCICDWECMISMLLNPESKLDNEDATNLVWLLCASAEKAVGVDIVSGISVQKPSDKQRRKAHPTLSEHERKRLCRVMDCQKLSIDACMHAAQNERLPLRVVVQVLFSEQVKISNALANNSLNEAGGESNYQPMVPNWKTLLEGTPQSFQERWAAAKKVLICSVMGLGTFTT